MDGKTWTLNLAGDIGIVVPADAARLSTYVFLEQEDWFEDEAAFVRRLVRPGDRILDVGANLGFYALTAARAAGAGGRVWAVEPTPETAALLRRSVGANGLANLDVLELALGETRGTAALHRAGDHELNRIEAAGGDGPGVRMERLDDLVAAAPAMCGIDLVKIDVEGHEPAVIEGGAAFFARESPLVMFEITDGRTESFAAADRFRALGYALYRLLPEPLLLVPFAGARTDPTLLNLFAAKPDRAAGLAARGLLAMHLPPAAAAELSEVAAFLSTLPTAYLGAALDKLTMAVAPEKPYGRALRHYVAARRADAAPEARAAALLAAFDAARHAVAERAGVPRLATFARLARAVGRRSLAFERAWQLVEIVLRGGKVVIDEPYLPMLPAYESWASPTGAAGWFAAMTVEAAWRWSAFSSSFGEPSLGGHPVDFLRQFGRDVPEFERRRQLRSMKLGRQHGPQPHPALAVRSADNRNPEFWAGVR